MTLHTKFYSSTSPPIINGGDSSYICLITNVSYYSYLHVGYKVYEPTADAVNLRPPDNI